MSAVHRGWPSVAGGMEGEPATNKKQPFGSEEQTKGKARQFYLYNML